MITDVNTALSRYLLLIVITGTLLGIRDAVTDIRADVRAQTSTIHDLFDLDRRLPAGPLTSEES